MPVLINLRHLKDQNLHLRGQLAVEELDINKPDELIRLDEPLAYDLEAQLLDRSVLVQGQLRLMLDCECARCLQPYRHELRLPNWACHLPLEGEEKAEVVNDCVDLTPHIREDIVLAFPQHPLCGPGCKGWNGPSKDIPNAGAVEPGTASPAWAELNKLRFEK